VTALAAKPAPHAVRLDWKNPADPDVQKLIVVQAAGTTPPTGITAGTIVANLPAGATSFVDGSAGLAPGKKYSYSVFAQDVALSVSVAAGITVTLPAALTVTPVDVAGDITQQAADAALTDTGSLAFTAFEPKNPRIAAVLPAAGVTGTLTRILTEPVGAAPGAVAWTYTVQNSALRSLAEGAKRDELFVIELRDGKDRVPTPVTVTLHGINDAPTASAVAPQTAVAGEAFAFPIPAGTFADVDATDVLTISTSPLPAWLSFSGTGFTGNPGTGDGGITAVTLTATDPHGVSVSVDVSIDVVQPLPAPNQPPAPGADAVTFDLGVDPLQTSAALLTNDSDPDAGPNALSAIPAAFDWMVGGELAGSYTIDAAGTLVLNSGVVADGPLQRLAPGEEATGTITYAVTDGLDTVESQITVTVIGAAPKAGEYDVAKVFVPPATGPGRMLAITHH
jgi:VCBS repeat-containing protein